MTDQPVEPSDVAQVVEGYVDRQHSQAAKYSNAPLLGPSGVYELHTLAAQIYQLGFNEGARAERFRNDGERRRIRRGDTDA
ncbi:hypothetical protein MN032_10995 [Agromyces atrinae]|uniref:hypothetical protein n=1 Tax=Agromyces atrinae TaxID=592376 RepID=UPI001F5AF953|nr:hypothetical protein [Agromyces atrinae]MCI2958224.1 hypothetical protein [Agromyces atrinae]